MKTEYAKNLYNDLMNLVNETDSSFYFTDQEENGQMYRIFNYRLASYTEFLKPNALNCRGTMFYINENNEFLGLAALPPAKFFNDGEIKGHINSPYELYNRAKKAYDESELSEEIFNIIEKEYKDKVCKK